ncbi:MAG: SpoIID/LytB domain-containing protein [Cyanobacteria bacterium J06649_4]
MLKPPLISRLLKSQIKSQTKASDTAQSELSSVDSATVDSATKSLQRASGSVGLSFPDPIQPDAAKPGSKSTSSKRKRRLSRRTLTAATAVLAILAAGGGYALMRFAPTRLEAALMPNGASLPGSGAIASSPVSRPGDPVAEPLVTTGDLYLTHQILFRKLEALTGLPVVPAGTGAGTLPATAPSDSSSATGTSNPKPEDTAKSDGSATTPSQPQAERVIAAAPPAPQAAPVDFSGTTIDSVLEMRVAVAKDVSAIGFATSSNGVIADLDGNTLKSLSPESTSLAEISGGIVVDGETMPSAFWVYPEDGGYVAVGDSWFRGRVLIALRERGLIAVNYVLLGDYLYSVVGTEMSPTWSIESLKAQAVAARSYALTHNIRPASEAYFDLDNTQRFQAYKGIAREANTTQLAVKSTAGEFISHEGGIVESLYAASQAIVDDAHKGSGMSQLGAKDLAEQGYSYQEILAHYYPGTALGRLETDTE